jgi:hypothetical protein
MICDKMERNQGFENSLRCLQHPSALLSTAVLLLNDHVFKIISPSWSTGKLSDFAGLFFFPFVVAAGLSLLLSKFKLKSHDIGQLAFGFVAIWFILLKIFPLVNSLTAQFASTIIGLPTQFILDWTDIFGLTVMIPAWYLWNQPPQWRPTKFAYITLAIGAFAAIATSPIEWTVTSVTDLVYSDDGVIYAADRETFGIDSYPIAKSLDGGITWEFDNEKENLQELGEKNYPTKQCLSELSEFDSRICYRVTNNYQLEVSYDNEEHWYEVFYSQDISIKARDLLIITLEEKEYLLVAIGESGILRRELLDGNWEIIEVINAKNR